MQFNRENIIYSYKNFFISLFVSFGNAREKGERLCKYCI